MNARSQFKPTRIFLRFRAIAWTIAFLSLMLSAPGRLSAQDKPLTEKEKIEALIKHVGGLREAVFIRNDREYGAQAAARFLRAKWEAQTQSIKTATDFIEKAASVSSTTGKPYMIRLKDGKEIKSGEYLTRQLKKLESESERE